MFNCVSSGKAQSANFPFCTIEPNVGSTNVPDKRLEVLTEICQPKRTIPATVEIVDIAGLVKGASKGEGLGNQFLANIRETDAILHVLRCFDDGNIVHVDGSVDPVRDKEVVDMELQIKDLETVENRIKKVEKQATTGGDKEAKKLLSLLQRYREVLLQGKSCRVVVPENPEEEQMARDLYLLTNKPVMYVCNVDEASAATGNAYVDAVRAAVADENAEILVIAARTEAEIAEIEEYEDRQMFLEEMGLSESGVVRLIQGAYRLLGLQTFFTAGADARPPVSSTPTSSAASSAPRSSSTTTSSTTRPKPPSAPPARWASKARTTSSRTATSCISCLTCKGPCHIERSFPCHFERSAAKSRKLPT